MEELPSDVEEILDEGTFCYVGTSTRHGPHVTPMVFTVSNDRVWVTTSRGSVKAHSWRDDAQIGGLVRSDDASVTFTGRVRTFDLLETDSWGRDVREAPALTRAAARFTKKNAHFFAGYAVDARHVPLSWTPPGRVFASVELERAAVVGREHVVEPFGAWPDAVASLEGFRAARRGDGPLLGLPYDVREALGVEGFGALALVYGVLMLVGALAGRSDPLQPLAGVGGMLNGTAPVAVNHKCPTHSVKRWRWPPHRGPSATKKCV